MIYELWDASSRNLIGTYDEEDEALALVREVLTAQGKQAASMLALGRQNKKGHSQLLATGAELVKRAQAGVSALDT